MKDGKSLRRNWFCFLAAVLAAVFAAGCQSTAGEAEQDTEISEELTYTGSMELAFARQFSVDFYDDDYSLITIQGDGRFLVVPEEKEAPADLAEDITVLKQPLDHIYLAASAVMDMFVSADALDCVRFSAFDAAGWYIEEAKAAMQSGDICYAGKYSAPDYEQILAGHCDLAIENTMIYHTPEVKEQLERFGIPVIVDHSSYEAQPLGRTEWVKLYGLLTGREAAAEAAFTSQTEAFAAIDPADAAGKTVAFFYITTNGEVNVRKASDYLPRMIELAGGSYVFSDLGADDGTASSSVTMQMEEFYAAVRDVDYMIYNSTIDGELDTVDDLLEKSALFANVKAVQEGHLYGTSRNLYQSSMELGTIISDMHKMLTGNDGDMTYLYRISE
ncbi:MAG: ABC transporter substrate-binding protein [Clostridiales bacterium]|nr:ABC transporter substrate-binding protein [Clostridiales bacterium]